MSRLRQDLQYAWRALRRTPAFTTIAIATLALGIGATTAIFTVLDGVVLDPLPYRSPEQIVNIWEDFGVGNQSLPAVAPADFLDYRKQAKTFEGFAAASGGNFSGVTGVLTGNNAEPEQVVVSPVTANFFQLLGVDPLIGRHFTAEDEQSGSNRVMVLSHDIWARRYGADPSIVNSKIEMDGQMYLVVAVLPSSFRLHLPAEAFLVRHSDVWIPLRFDVSRLPPRNFTLFTVLGRLKPETTLAQAQAEMDEILRGFHRDFPEHASGQTRVRVVPLQDDVVKGAKPALERLLWATAIVLLIACANVAHLLVARSSTRRTEIAVRTALGASRQRLVRQMLTESLLLAVAGGFMGLVLAMLGTTVLKQIDPGSLPRLAAIGINARVLAYAIAATLATVLLFGLAPALHASGQGIAGRLTQRGVGSNTAGATRMRNALIVAEISLSLVLLVAAGLLLRSFFALQDVRPGFEADRALTFSIPLVRAKYQTLPVRMAALDEIKARLEALPGVEHVGFTAQLPLTGTGPLSPYAYNAETARNWESATADGRRVSSDYFAAMGTRLIAGRPFGPEDGQAKPERIIIDETLAARAWPEESAVGKKLQMGPGGGPSDFSEVIGVVEHMRVLDLSRDVRSLIFSPTTAPPVPSPMFGVVRTTGDPMALAAGVRAAIAEFDPGMPVQALQPMSNYVNKELGRARFAFLLMVVFASVALALAAIGIYGVMAYSVTQRTREIGIRLALGEAPGQVRRTVLLSAARLLIIAVPIGVVGALLAGRLLTGLVFGVKTSDPATFAVTTVLLASVAIMASFVPARRATRIDPIDALRAE